MTANSVRSRPAVVCLCGSTRFADEFNRQRIALTCAGQIVLSIEIVTTQAPGDDPQHVDPWLKARLDMLHKAKIDLADYVLVLNVGPYIGPSTRSEIELRHPNRQTHPLPGTPRPGPGQPRRPRRAELPRMRRRHQHL